MNYEKGFGETQLQLQHHQQQQQHHQQQQQQQKQQQQYKNKNNNKRNSIQTFWNDQIMERFIKANLFMICCVAAGLLLVSEKLNWYLYTYVHMYEYIHT